jgi:hypothetical protein
MDVSKSPVPALSRGLQILRMLSTPMTLEEIARESGVPKSSAMRIVSTLRMEGLVVRDPRTRVFQAATKLSDSRTLKNSVIMPGDSEWQITPGPWWLLFSRYRNAVAHVTTYGSRGDADMGYMWRRLPSDPTLCRLRFTVHGGHAQVALIRGGGDIPISADVPRIHRDVFGGKYGDIVAIAEAADSNEVDVPVSWDLTGSGGDPLKVIIIDALDEPWGFISVSRMLLQRL